MPDKIFGYEWETIQRAQRGEDWRPKIDSTKPAKAPATDSDRALLAQYGSLDALKAVGLHGVADRLEPA